ncbi:MAG: TonB-dependent receptor [Methylomonas sp.]|nr:TonB-dependent receptor [Methylomonas sp.]PPD22891.1 MAG: TonB-dependent receptor [Methylomonas sp.]PPD27387.1 MAG: TonB-dependent receptor [Methylomonas sp.]PPD39363.1 MAG: TonB-dependent receptor [Methylomonas sp.]PPD41986.1 MAG: TonB-dependent receptor [Methylomonas sp.]
MTWHSPLPARLLAAASLLLAGHVVAAPEDLTDLSLEELLKTEVISASRLAQKSSESPSSLSVVTADDIRTFGWRTLAEALNAMRGLFTSNDRNYSFLGVRGFDRPEEFNGHILFMIDGQRMNENIFDSANIGNEFMLDLDLIERIEFIPGSGAAIYGNNAFLGMVNVVTKQGRAINGVQMAGDARRFDTYQGRISYGKTLDNGADVLLSATHFDSAGPETLYFPAFDSPATYNGIATRMDGERSDRLYGRVQFEAFTLAGGYVGRHKRVPTAAYGERFNDPVSHTDDRQFYGNLTYEKALTDASSVRMRGFYQGYEYCAGAAYLDAGSRVVNHDESSGRWWGGEAQLTTRAFERHRIILGLEYQHDLRQRLLNVDLDPYALLGYSNRSGHRVQVFAQDDIQLRDDLILSAGLRFDHHHMLENIQLNPRLGLIWHPVDSTTFKLLYGSSFRAPNAWNLDYNPYFYGVRTTLAEERIRSYESVVEWRGRDGIKLLGTLFFNDISQMLQPHPDTALLDNLGRYHAYGGELEAEKRWRSGRLFKLSYTYSRVDDENRQSAWAIGSPQNLVKIHYAEPLFDDIARLGVETIYIGDRKTYGRNIADAYGLVNLNLASDRLVHGLDVSVGVYNLLDSRFLMLGSGIHDTLPMNGREWRVKLQLSF